MPPSIEAKASRTLGRHDLRSLIALREVSRMRHYVVVCLEERPRTVDGIEIMGWRDFLERLWAGGFGTT
jgi:hypothetical protein